MDSERHREPRRARARKCLLSKLCKLSCLLNLGVLVCLAMLMAAGTSLVNDVTGMSNIGHPGMTGLNLPSLSMVSFNGLIGSVDPSDRWEPQYRYYPRFSWYLNSFGWYAPYDEEGTSAAYMYVRPAAALSMPQIMHDSIASINSSTYLLTCRWPSEQQYDQSHGSTYACSVDVIEQFLDGLDAAAPLTLTTAPAFLFYVVTMALCLAIMLFEWARPALGEGAVWYQRRYQIRAWMYGVMVLAHLIAALVVTGEAARLMYYLGQFPNLNMEPQFGRAFLPLVWAAFVASFVSGSATMLRWRLKWVWNGMADEGTVRLETMGAARRREQELRGHVSAEHGSTEEDLPKYSRTDPLELASKIERVPSYTEDAGPSATGRL